jgi:CheY-like chemotaxis protein
MNPILRFDIVDTLNDAGFHVHEAGNATEAIEILTQNTGIRLVFTRRRHARRHGRDQVGRLYPRPLAALEDHRHVRIPEGHARGDSRRELLFQQILWTPARIVSTMHRMLAN